MSADDPRADMSPDYVHAQTLNHKRYVQWEREVVHLGGDPDDPTGDELDLLFHPVLTAAAAFHLAGKHDQHTHGRGSSVAAFDDCHAHAADEPFSAVPKGLGGYEGGDGEFHEFATDTPEQGAALERYFHGAKVNESLRKHKGVPSSSDATGTKVTRNPEYDVLHPKGYTYEKTGDAAHDVGLIDDAMDSSVTTHDMMVYRGAPTKAFGTSYRAKESMAGTSFSDHGYTSTSGSHETAMDYAGGKGVLLRIAVPQGSHALGLSVDAGGGEGEILLPRGSKFKVVRDNGKLDDFGGMRVLDVTFDDA